MAAIFEEIQIFGKTCWFIFRDTLWVKSFVEIALLHMVFEIQAFLCFPYLENS